MQVNLPELILTIPDGPNNYHQVMQHIGPHLQGQSMNMHSITSLAYGRRIKISFVCTLTCLFFVIFRTLSVTALWALKRHVVAGQPYLISKFCITSVLKVFLTKK